MSITHEAYLNIVPGDSPAPIIKVSQYDADFSIVFHLIAKKRGIVPAYPRTVENDEDVTINVPTSATVSVRGTKTDGNGYSANATLSGTATAPIVTVAGHEQMTASAGVNVYEITFYADNATKRLSTANFILFVEPAALDASTITSESLMLELNDLIASVPNAVAAADRAEAAAQSVSSSAAQIEQNRQNISDIMTDLDAITPIDNTLRNSGKPADAKKVGDEIADIRADLSHIGLSDDVKTSLLACFSHVAWVDAHGQDYYDALEAALYADSYPRITAVFNAGVNVIYTDDALDTLKQYLTVKYFETKDSAGTVVASNDYTLSGVLVEGTSTITVAYDEVRTSVGIPGVVDFYNIWEWSLGDGSLIKNTASVDANLSDTTKYPSRMLIFLNYNDRRNFSVTKGKAPYYLRNQNAVASQYYPTPIPKNANHMKITMEPTGQYINFTTNPYDTQNNYYLNDVTANRPGGWQLLSNGVYEKDIVQSDSGQLFLVLNAKCNAEGSGYPIEPTNLTIEFSEV